MRELPEFMPSFLAKYLLEARAAAIGQLGSFGSFGTVTIIPKLHM